MNTAKQESLFGRIFAAEKDCDCWARRRRPPLKKAQRGVCSVESGPDVPSVAPQTRTRLGTNKRKQARTFEELKVGVVVVDQVEKP